MSKRIVWKTEGPTDLLALVSLGLPEGHNAKSNLFGAGENPLGLAADGFEKETLLHDFRGCVVYVVHDCDKAGQDGAMCLVNRNGRTRLGWAHAIAKYADEVRNVILPYPIEERDGKDLRDWINDRLAVHYPLHEHETAESKESLARSAVYQELLAYAQTMPIVPNPDPNGEMVVSVVEASDEDELIEAGEDVDSILVNEEIDDPHRLARINLDTYRDAYGREVKYWNETWYLWKSGQYIEITKDHFEARITASIKREFDRQWFVDDEAYKDRVERDKKSGKYDPDSDKGPPKVRKVNSSLVANVIGATRSMCFVSSNIEMHSWIDGRKTNDTFVSVRNGMLNLTAVLSNESEDEDVMQPHDPNWFSTSKLPYNFCKTASAPTWERFLNDVFNGDEESITALQMWFGYLLTPDVSLHKVLFVIGQTRSGKGTILSVLRELLGHESIATPTLSSLGKDFGLASLVGKTAAIIADARMPGKGDESIITERLLNITGGDPVSISRKFKGNLEDFRLSCRFTLFSNLLPRLRDASAVFVNRCIFLAMPNSYLGREDRTLGPRLLEEMSGILNWAILGREKLDAAGRISQPISGLSLLSELQSILSPVSMFLQEFCETGPEYEVVTKTLFDHWAEWCIENDVSHPGDIQSFGRKLKAVLPGLGTERKKINPSDYERQRVYVGLKIKQDASAIT